MSDSQFGFWKNKLFALFKKHRLSFPKPKIIAKAECCIQIGNEVVHIHVPIIVNKDIKKQAYEKLYAEVYDTMHPQLEPTPKEKHKTKKKQSKLIVNQIPSSKTLAFDPIDESNVGHKILEKIGWVKGQGLGSNQEGMPEPISLVIRKKKSGLGS